MKMHKKSNQAAARSDRGVCVVIQDNGNVGMDGSFEDLAYQKQVAEQVLPIL